MISQKEFKQRRKTLMRQMKKRSVLVLAAAPTRYRNRDADYPYRQTSDFLYLTGFNEPEAVLVLAPGRDGGEFVLFCREFDATRAIWTGRHAGLDGAMADYGADEAFPIGSLADRLPGLLEGHDYVYTTIGEDAPLEEAVKQALSRVRERSRAGVRCPRTISDAGELVHELRIRKTAAELSLMRKAAAVSAEAHCRAMRQCRPGLHEYEIEAELLHEFTRRGLRSPAYSSIVAGGANACVLHYVENNAPLRDGDLLLIDAGAECEGYAADITRTFPVNGRFSDPQKALYELVLDAQSAAIEQVKPGNSWMAPHDAAVKTLVKGLIKLGLLHGRPGKLIKDEAYKKFYMHRTGHWLGLDVHDVGDYRRDDDWRTLEPGMVLTVEPGLYVAPDCTDVEPKWRGIGIRIEDDALVTQTGHEILTGGAPKTVADIEALMAGA